MEYHTPAGKPINIDKKTHNIGGIGHICLKVGDIESAFEHIKNSQDTRLISTDERYHPHYISTITPDDFRFFDNTIEANRQEKHKVCHIISKIRYFYFIDKYNIQWEFEQGHDDIGE